MLITGARIAMSSSTTSNLNLWLDNGRVSFSPVVSPETPILHLHKCLVFPGLINAHDHLELNLFPKLGCGPYSNASAWAKDIYRPEESPVKQHLKVPKPLRLRWGGIKNLISGVTTVAHHNAFHPVFLEPGFPVRVVKRYGWAHSIEFSPDWETRLRDTPPDYPFVIHAAEGTDEAASRELQILAKAGALNDSTVLVHGVGITCSDVPLLKATNTSLVWCPTSNHFTLNCSPDTGVLNSGIPVALGSDSAMTADGDLLDELRFAHRTIDAHSLYRMVTSVPARMLKLPTGFGQICDGGPADLLVMRDSSQTPANTLLENYPQLVIVGGRIQLVSSDFARICPTSILKSLQPLDVEGRDRYLVSADILSLLNETTRALEGAPRLAGKAIAA
jgi:cytosine/adenosine deaminase-related metal-dependent hydrolase